MLAQVFERFFPPYLQIFILLAYFIKFNKFVLAGRLFRSPSLVLVLPACSITRFSKKSSIHFYSSLLVYEFSKKCQPARLFRSAHLLGSSKLCFVKSFEISYIQVDNAKSATTINEKDNNLSIIPFQPIHKPKSSVSTTFFHLLKTSHINVLA